MRASPVAMIIPKMFVAVFLLCFVSGCWSKPTESDITTGRGIGSTLWGWLTYPFSWWSSELPPVNDQLVGSTTTYGPNEVIEIAKHNVTVWCNDQTCTTMKCDKFGCHNVTCNIYDTDLMGECREYNIASTLEDRVPKPTESIPKPVEDKVTESPEKIPDTTSPLSVATSTTQKDNPPVEEHPLELEAVLSSTVNGGDKASEDKDVLNSEQKV